MALCIKKFFSIIFPIPTINGLYFQLKKKYRLYIVANQPKEAKDVLNNLGLINCFDKIYLDTIVGFSKPDLEFYKYVLHDSGAIVNETIYIGDRLDNDIIPTLQLQIVSIKLVFPIHQGFISRIDKNFVESFYDSINKLWYRMIEDKSYNYRIAHSYGEILEVLK